MTAPLSLCHGRHLPPARRHPRPGRPGRRRSRAAGARDRTPRTWRPRSPGPRERSSPRAQNPAPGVGGIGASSGRRPAPLGGRRRRGLPAARKRFPGGHHRRRRLSRRPRRRRAAFLSPLAGKMRVSSFCLRRSQRRPPEPGAFSRGGAQAPGAKRENAENPTGKTTYAEKIGPQRGSQSAAPEEGCG